jgi:hypothetical protein
MAIDLASILHTIEWGPRPAVYYLKSGTSGASFIGLSNTLLGYQFLYSEVSDRAGEFHVNEHTSLFLLV